MKSLRILSLLPAATEMVYLLGLEKYLVGVSHECDYPPRAKQKVQVTSSIVDNTMSSNMIDKKVKKAGHRGRSRLAEDGESRGVFHIKKGILEKLRPNLILTQELCEVCAITPPVILRSEGGPSKRDKDLKIISLEPESVEDILENILLIGEATGKQKRAEKEVEKLKKRLLRLPRNDVRKKPRVLVIEWLDPIMVAGHWIPEMVERAGGKNLISNRGSMSKIVTLDQIVASKPDILVISPCGFDIKRIRQEMALVDKIVKAVNPGKWELIDGNAYMTRPGPRIVDGIEKLADVISSL